MEPNVASPIGQRVCEDLPADAADLLERLNARIEDDDFKIGPSYLMCRRVHEDGGLERVWWTSIIP